MPLVTRLAREMRLKIFEVDRALEVLRVPQGKILAREVRLKTIKGGNVASAASHDIDGRNAIEIFLKSTKLWRCSECCWSRY